MSEQMATTTTATVSEAKGKTRIFPIGFALFAMFFGAGNLIFPLAIGVTAGQNLPYAVIGFLLTGVGVPFLGLFATSLFEGDYEAFFNRLGKIPALLVISFLMLIIGPLSAMPRTEVVTYQTIKLFLPAGLNSGVVFSLLYCGLMFLFTYRETKMMTILGFVLSPVKLMGLSILILVGIFFGYSSMPTSDSVVSTMGGSLFTGYNTMDLLATFFFCSICK